MPLQNDELHKDSFDENEVTILYYTAKEWKKEWGGETIVSNERVTYVPNRAVIYPSTELHGGVAPKPANFRTYINYVGIKI